MDYQIEQMKREDWSAIHAIHAEGIATGLASFAENAPDWEEWDGDYLQNGRFVARSGNGILGWAALASVSSN
ncbi:MAG: hypothetical protein AAF614_00300 [Chloroflexota bacterium]